jgi:hypothetical protein
MKIDDGRDNASAAGYTSCGTRVHKMLLKFCDRFRLNPAFLSLAASVEKAGVERVCGTCGKGGRYSYMKCYDMKCSSRCSGSCYCNGACQLAHWPTHKQACKMSAD